MLINKFIMSPLKEKDFLSLYHRGYYHHIPIKNYESGIKFLYVIPVIFFKKVNQSRLHQNNAYEF